MTCPNCSHQIPEEFYCIGCGFVPAWARNSVEIAAFEHWREDFEQNGVKAPETPEKEAA
jgi:hypothetical protein